MKKSDHQLVQNVLDGELTTSEFDAFQQRLRNEPELFGFYRDYAQLHHTLCEEFETTSPPSAVITAPIGGRLFRRLLVFLMLSGVALTVLVMTNPWSNETHDHELALATFSLDSVYSMTGNIRHTGGATGMTDHATLNLTMGRAGLFFKPSVRAVVDGPANATLPSPNVLQLSSGKVLVTTTGTGNSLTVTTPTISASGENSQFGIITTASGSELHVISGLVTLKTTKKSNNITIKANEAVRISNDGNAQQMAADKHAFADNLGRFRAAIHDPYDVSQWRIAYGSPTITEARIDGRNYAMFHPLPTPASIDHAPIMLATLTISQSASGPFHTEGWAGLSLFDHEMERVFFGDCYGTAAVWALDVKQNQPVIVPDHPLTGPATVTLRYDARTGEVSLHEGKLPLQPPFCHGHIPVGTRFDAIRIGASSSASLCVVDLDVRTGGESSDP